MTVTSPMAWWIRLCAFGSPLFTRTECSASPNVQFGLRVRGGSHVATRSRHAPAVLTNLSLRGRVLRAGDRSSPRGTNRLIIVQGFVAPPPRPADHRRTRPAHCVGHGTGRCCISSSSAPRFLTCSSPAPRPPCVLLSIEPVLAQAWPAFVTPPFRSNATSLAHQAGRRLQEPSRRFVRSAARRGAADGAIEQVHRARCTSVACEPSRSAPACVFAWAGGPTQRSTFRAGDGPDISRHARLSPSRIAAKRPTWPVILRERSLDAASLSKRIGPTHAPTMFRTTPRRSSIHGVPGTPHEQHRPHETATSVRCATLPPMRVVHTRGLSDRRRARP